ncbi:hypothetical protein GCM10010363_60110 [Streptomyces omiyaensis]|uniref:hypothetical protein n=1 Tax=Streptomyces omiyaensis TaxID=68247 RepID=UPI001671CC2C|nr:hypothetical protein [Streptomyces omiyaensis]GGY70977.1 hypothetical protein GCM10010363_60110 [Streptomyces omiyaensis]
MSAKTSRRMPWRLALLVPAAAYLAIWRGVPGLTPMLAFTWVQSLLVAGGVILAGLYGPQALAAMAKAQKEAAARRKIRAEKAAKKAASAKSDANLRKTHGK